MGAGSSADRPNATPPGCKGSRALACWIPLCVSSSSSPSSRAKLDVARPASSSSSSDTRAKNGSIQNQTVRQIAPSSASPSDAGNISPPTTVADGLKVALQLRRFTFNEIKCATRNFRPESLLGEGGFGRVYKGWISENGSSPVRPGAGLPVAVKTLNRDGKQGHKEWLAEVNFLGNLRHENLVKLIGYCLEDDHRQLVYEFMPRGSLEHHLFRKAEPLQWSTRIKIALGAAKGLAFLHEKAERPVIYRDFKTANVLLDADYNAKLSDFGLARDGPEGDKTHVSTRVMGTYGYAAPEYVMTGHLTSKSDVYSFGVVLLELITGRRSMDKNRPAREQNLVEWARPHLRDGRGFYNLVDPKLGGNMSVHSASKVTWVARHCLYRSAKKRPLMSQVVGHLETLSEVQDAGHPSGSRSIIAQNRQQQSVRSLSCGPRGHAAAASPYRSHHGQASSQYRLQSPRTSVK